jgi:hypothetical protein
VFEKKISDLYLVWSIDLENGGGLFQIIRIWGLVALQNIRKTIEHLQNLFSMYTDNYVEHSKIVHREGYVLQYYVHTKSVSGIILTN